MNAQSTIPLNNGSNMPVVGLGTWQLTGDQAVGSLVFGLQLGYRMIDTSGDYNNHSAVGRAIRTSGLPRDKLFIVTKVEETDDARTKAGQNVHELGLEHADLMLIHRPPGKGVGEDLWAGLVRARDDGLTKNIGVSNYSIEQMQELIEASGQVPAINQIEWTPFGFSKDMLDFCQRHNIIIQAYSPLTRGERLDDDALQDIAEHYNKTPAQLLLRWNIQHGVVPIVKAAQRRHMQEDIQVFDFDITPKDMQTLDNLNEQYSSLSSKPLYI